MDKYFWYVLLTYVASFGVLFGYLAWLWARLRGLRDEQTTEAPR